MILLFNLSVEDMAKSMFSLATCELPVKKMRLILIFETCYNRNVA